MTNQTQPALLAAIAELQRRYPEWRLGQLIANLAGWADQEVWDAEDEQLLAAALSHLRQFEVSGTALTPEAFVSSGVAAKI